MKERRSGSNRSKTRKELYRLTFTALMVPLSVVLGYIARLYMTFLDNQFRITFENLPLIIVGITIGPVYGAVAGLSADLISSLVTAQNINPIITAGVASVGAISGIAAIMLKKTKKPVFSLSVSVFAGEAVGSMLIKSLGLAIMYGSPFFLTLGLKIANYIPIAFMETVIIYIAMKNKSVSKMLGSIK